MNITKQNVLMVLESEKKTHTQIMVDMKLSGKRHEDVLRATLYRLVQSGKVTLSTPGYFEKVK